MSDILQKLLQARAELRQEAGWPRWMAEALAYKPDRAAPVVSPHREQPRWKPPSEAIFAY
ncbi:hypothetical protein [Bradyrhizobium tunisiense]|uniref:hypothetical protein n=1 Tax=Bradyrhizobium tunisiense TaxID=3278709 RepID=UPI0035DB1241